MRAAELYEKQLELECKRLLSSGRLESFPCDNPDGLAMVSAVRFLDGTGEAIRLRVDAADDVELLARRLTVSDLLEAAEPGSTAGVVMRRNFSGRTGILDRVPDRSEFPDAEPGGGGWIVRIAGDVAARAFSARENSVAAELSVETTPGYRRRGFARQVAAAWAAGVVASDRVAFYSYDFSNTASAALAQSLDVRFQFDVGSFDLEPHT